MILIGSLFFFFWSTRSKDFLPSTLTTPSLSNNTHLASFRIISLQLALSISYCCVSYPKSTFFFCSYGSFSTLPIPSIQLDAVFFFLVRFYMAHRDSLLFLDECSESTTGVVLYVVPLLLSSVTELNRNIKTKFVARCVCSRLPISGTDGSCLCPHEK